MAKISIPLLAAQLASKVVDAGLLSSCMKHGFGRVEWLILTALVDGETYPTTQLAHIVGAQQPTTTKAVDRLVARSLATRSPASQDRRVVGVTLTSSGRSFGRMLINEWENGQAEPAKAELKRVLETGKRLIQAPPS